MMGAKGPFINYVCMKGEGGHLGANLGEGVWKWEIIRGNLPDDHQSKGGCNDCKPNNLGWVLSVQTPRKLEGVKILEIFQK